MSRPDDPSDARVVDIDSVRAEALSCIRCPLARSRTNVVWADGNLDADLLFIGEAPGFHEDQQGIPFVGAAGQLLDRMLAEIGLDRTQAAIVNVLKCRPPGNRDPRPEEIEACKPYLEAQLAHMRPKVIVTLGNFATRFVLEEQIGITRARGRVYERRGAKVVPTFHPAAALRGGRFGGMSPVDAIRADLQTVRHLLDRARAVREPVAAGASAAEPVGATQLGLF
ncbi:MAG TPA: uracil-DNA glycosylase [Actinomycetota bacterium]|jgi:uracil-DNA glycosylase|nr:uracil-DNA glycosylase [Actinomycetota bacterium]